MKKRERIYECCGKVSFTFSKAPRCTTCAAEQLYSEGRNKIKKQLEDLGHINVIFNDVNKSGKITVTFTHTTCGTTQTWQASNITKVLAKDPTTAPCSSCGSKRRTAKATIASALANGIPDHLLPAWDAYSRKVRRLTEKNYKANKQLINPLNLPRGIYSYHLDHRFPVIEGFLQGHPAEQLAAVSNLQFLSATDNLSKGRRLI